ncbi:MAG: pirin family protein [Deltaproteobacteria bacterium]|nr:pirin family protein [Deltaproteobacteria bacterium]
MIIVRPSSERGHANYGWLDTYHSFSFGSYFSRHHMGFRSLRVINEDYVAPMSGFETHPHQNMEIFTYMVSGTLHHRDSMGKESYLQPGQVQLISAGSGITHSEHNSDQHESVHLLQVWIKPEQLNIEPSYQEKKVDVADRLSLIASFDGRNESLIIRQRASIYAANFLAPQNIQLDLENGEHAWVQVISGEIEVFETSLHAGDGAAISGVRSIPLKCREEAHFLLFDLL